MKMIGKPQISEPAWKHKASFASFSFFCNPRGPPSIKDPFQIPLLSYSSWAPTSQSKTMGRFYLIHIKSCCKLQCLDFHFEGLKLRVRVAWEALEGGAVAY